MKQLLFISLLLVSFSCTAKWHQQQFEVMGTQAKVEFEADNDQLAAKLIEQVIAEMHRIDHLMSPFKTDSELSRINQQASEHPVIISDELFDLLKKSNYYSQLTQGAFDISFSSVGYLYDYRKHQRPNEQQKRHLTPKINYLSIRLNKLEKSVKFDNDKLKIDLGGIAKGHAVDRCIDILIKHGIKNAFINAGGDSRVIGKKNDRLWYIGIRHPREIGKLIVNLPLEQVAISTSGDYERFFIEEGVRYHHIIDPKTGDSVRGSQSVTILASSSMVADALSTSIFVLGPIRGLQLINQMPDVSAIIIDQQGNMHYSDDMISAN
jgi:thiamine biosynthesis lipoprotein